MTHFDVLVIGGGTGNNTAMAAAERGLETALVEPGPLGGTCLNRGCNPSKMLIQRANVVNTVREGSKFGVDAHVEDIRMDDFVDEVFEDLGGTADWMADQFREYDNITWYREKTRFVDERTVELDGEEVTADQVVVAAGSRPLIPPFEGVDDVDYLTSQEAIHLTEAPEELVIVGGGYIAAELGYYFDGMGSDVALVEMMDRLLPREDRAVGEEFTKAARERHDVYTGSRVEAIERDDGRIVVHADTDDGPIEIEGTELLIAVGRRPNTDSLEVENADIETDDRGFIETDEYLRASADGVWAQGDIAGNHMFKHTGDYETDVMIDNLLDGAEHEVDYTAVGHAVFTKPQVGATGKTESQLEEEGLEYVVGTQRFEDTIMAGRAHKEKYGVAKILAAPDGELLGAHVIGKGASDLVHEAMVAKRLGGTVQELAEMIYVHPTLSKAMKSAFEDAASKL